MGPGSPALELVDDSLSSFDIAVLVVAIQEGGENSVLAWCVRASVTTYHEVLLDTFTLVQGFENITPCRDTYSLLRRSL